MGCLKCNLPTEQLAAVMFAGPVQAPHAPTQLRLRATTPLPQNVLHAHAPHDAQARGVAASVIGWGSAGGWGEREREREREKERERDKYYIHEYKFQYYVIHDHM